MNQGLDVHPLSDFVLDGERVGAGVAHVTGETGVDIVQDDNAQAHAIATMVLAGFDIVDTHISIAVH